MTSSICKLCGKETVDQFLSLGQQPMGNAFLREEEFAAERTFSLDLGFCTTCKLVQQVNPPPLDALKTVYQNYAYAPLGHTLQSHYANLGKVLAKEFRLEKESFVLDIGSNDGTLLRNIKLNVGCRILGVEPARRISEMAKQSGVPTITSFFDKEVASDVAQREGAADLITTIQVLQHIHALLPFTEEVARLTKDDGVFVIEGRYFVDTLKKASFDTLYHEMLYCFTLTSVVSLLEMVGMEAFKAQPIDIYGGSLRVYTKKTSNNTIPIDPSVSTILKMEKQQFVTFQAHKTFVDNSLRQRAAIRESVRQIKRAGKTIAGYGASSTGTTLLNFCDLNSEYVDYIVDENPLKQGLFTPGTHIPIVAPSILKEQPPDCLLIIAWRLADEIILQVKHQYGLRLSFTST